jgi:hypothetical protein
MTKQCCQPWESCVCVCVWVRVRACVCRKPQCLHETIFDLLNLFCPFWEMFRKWHDNTVIYASHMGNYMLHARGSETLQTFTFRLLTEKETTSVTFQTEGNITISLHVFAFLLTVEQYIVFIHDAVFSCTCVLLRNYWTLSYVTWRIFHSDTFPLSIPSPFFCSIIHKIAIRFCHWSSRATPGTPASLEY